MEILTRILVKIIAYSIVIYNLPGIIKRRCSEPQLSDFNDEFLSQQNFFIGRQLEKIDQRPKPPAGNVYRM